MTERLTADILQRDKAAIEYPRLVVCAVIMRDGHILLERRAPSGIAGLDNAWDLPGGKVEKAETPQMAIVREIKEELSVAIKVTRLCPEPLPSQWAYKDGVRHWLLVGCVCEILGGEVKTHESLQWFPLRMLPENTLQADRDLISQALGTPEPSAPATQKYDSCTYQCDPARDMHTALCLDRRHKMYSVDVDDCVAEAASLPERCPICDWPMAESVEKGCVPGNCSYRPHEGTAEYYRIQQRRQQLESEKPGHAEAKEAIPNSTWKDCGHPVYRGTSECGICEARRLIAALEEAKEAPGLDANWPECFEFYDLMQEYRHAPIARQDEVVKRYEAVKQWLRAALASAGRSGKDGN